MEVVAILASTGLSRRCRSAPCDSWVPCWDLDNLPTPWFLAGTWTSYQHPGLRAVGTLDSTRLRRRCQSAPCHPGLVPVIGTNPTINALSQNHKPPTNHKPRTSNVWQEENVSTPMCDNNASPMSSNTGRHHTNTDGGRPQKCNTSTAMATQRTAAAKNGSRNERQPRQFVFPHATRRTFNTQVMRKAWINWRAPYTYLVPRDVQSPENLPGCRK